MKIALLGAVCYDEIIALDGTRSESYGGILYNAAAFSSIVGPADTIVPISKIGTDHLENVLAEFRRLPHVDVSGLAPTAAPLTHVQLTWRTDSWRDERILNRMPPYDAETLQRAQDCDAVLINFINGTEFDLPGFRAFRRRYQGLIYLDVHQIISRFDEEGQREIVGFPQWADWTPGIDLLQCNEFELASMFPDAPPSRECFVDAATAICRTGPRAVVVTLGPEGALLIHRLGERLFAVELPPLPGVTPVDTTGCGDSFSAGFVFGLLTYNDAVTALACGAIVAGVKARQRGIQHLVQAGKLLLTPRVSFSTLNNHAVDWPGRPL